LVNFLGINPIKALFFTAIINGLLAPPLLALIMLISSDTALMGERANSTPIKIQRFLWFDTSFVTVSVKLFMEFHVPFVVSLDACIRR